MSVLTNVSPQPGEIALATAAFSGIQSYAIWGNNSFLKNGPPVPRPVVEIIYGGLAAYGSVLSTPTAASFLPKTASGAKDEKGDDVMIDNNFLQVLVPPSLSGAIHAGILYALNDERDKWEVLRNFLAGFLNQTVGYFAADAYENWNSRL